MGCGPSFSVTFKENETNPGQGKVAMEIFANILLKKYHRDALFTSFDDIDTDGSGLVHMDEFFSFFRLEPNEFNREIFRIFDTDGNGQLTFQEFVCVVWNFLSLRHTFIGHYVMFIFCGAASGRDLITTDEILNMIAMVHGRACFEQNKSLQEAIVGLKKDGQGMSINDLVRWMHDHPMVTNPILMLYSNLRHKLIGVKFWNKLSKIRYKNHYMIPITYVVDLAAKLEVDEILRLERLAQEEPDEVVVAKLAAPEVKKKPNRRGSLLEQVRSGKYNITTDPTRDLLVSDFDFSVATAGSTKGGTLARGGPPEDEYKSQRPFDQPKIPETVVKKVIVKKPRRKSLSKALSFVKGIGSSKKHKPVIIKTEGHRYTPQRKSSVVLAMDAIKSVTTDKMSRPNVNNGHKKKKRHKNDKIYAETDSSDAPLPVATDGAGGDAGWKKAERFVNH